MSEIPKAHVQHPGDVRRRDDDGIRGLGRLRVGGEATLLQPEVIPFVLDGLRLVGFGNFRHKQTRISLINTN